MSPFELIANALAPHSTLRHTWRLTGGVSAAVTALEIEQADGTIQKVVVRKHGTVDLQADPHIAANEFALLRHLQAEGIPVAAPLYLDESGVILATPYLVIEFVEGTSEIDPADLPHALPQIAAQLATIHRIEGVVSTLAFLPNQADRLATILQNRPASPDESLSEGRIRAALEAGMPLGQHNPCVLLHGDYWQGNLLWDAGRLVAILDWEDAAVGDPLADIANSRLELLWAFGKEAMAQFTEHYQSHISLNFSNLPYWDLYATLRPAGKLGTWGLDPATENAMRDQHRWFVEQALQQLTVNGNGNRYTGG